jgi:N-acetylglucosaminyldiphosphoundecaprenol N-acetyl-beta-D-mannosaminyltransferase
MKSQAAIVVTEDFDQQREEHFAAEACPTADVLGVRVDALNMQEALSKLLRMLRRREKGYLSAVTVHGVMMAQRDQEFAEALADASIVLADGIPTVWVGRLQGLRGMQQVTGPDLMREIFLRKEFAHYSHYLYGGNDGVADELAAYFKRLAPWVKIVGTRTPPFRPLDKMEERELIAEIRELRPDMIWIGLGAPKQDKFMRSYLPKLDTHLMFGVGAAFDFHTGRIRDCSGWIRRAGLQWLHRLLQDPKRLWWRYLRYNPEFILRIALQFVGVSAPASRRRSASTLNRRAS